MLDAGRSRVIARRCARVAALGLLLGAVMPSSAAAQERHAVSTAWATFMEQGRQHEARADRMRDDGQRQERRRAYRLALIAYVRAIDARPGHEEAYLQAGRVALAVHSYKEALAVLSRGLALVGGSVELRRQLGLALYLGGRRKAAVQQLLEVVKRKPDALDVLLLLGRHFARAGTCEPAARYLGRLIALSDRADARLMLGRCQLALGRHAAALATYRPLTAGGGAAAEGWLGVGRAQAALGRPRRAERALRRALAALPADQRQKVYLPLSEQLRLQGRHDEAQAQAASYIRDNPRRPWGYQQRGLICLSQRQPLRATEALRKAIALGRHTPWAQMLLSRAWRRLGRADRALAAAQVAASQSRELAIQDELAIAHRASGQHERAIALHRELIDRHGKRPALLVELGHDLLAVGRQHEAADSYRQALGLAPEHRGAGRGLAATQLNQGLIAARQGKIEQAQAELEQALRTRPGYPAALEALASIALGRGHPQEAGLALQRLGRERSPRARWLAGRVALAAGRNDEALVELRAAQRGLGAGAPPGLLLDLGSVEARAGAGERARELLSTAQRAGRAGASFNLALAALLDGQRLLDQGKPQLARNALLAIKPDTLPPELELRRVLWLGFARLALGDATVASELERAIANRLLSRVVAEDLRRAVRPLLRSRIAIAGHRDLRQSLARLERLTVATRWRPLLRRARDAARLALVRQAYRAGRFQVAARVVERGRSYPPALEHDVACATYRAGQRAAARQVFERLEAVVPEATANLGIAAEQIDGARRRAYDLYRKYLPRAGANARRVRRWIESKQRLFGFE